MLRCVTQVFLAFVLLLPAFDVAAQVQRNFPANAFRAEAVFGAPPEVSINGQATRLAPGARIRGANNMQLMSGALVGQKFSVHYTLEATSGLVKDVWVLTEAEADKKPWPRNAKEAASLRFDPLAQTWSKP